MFPQNLFLFVSLLDSRHSPLVARGHNTVYDERAFPPFHFFAPAPHVMQSSKAITIGSFLAQARSFSKFAATTLDFLPIAAGHLGGDSPMPF